VSGQLIDVNVNLGQWPTRRTAGDSPAALAARLKRHGVTEAWAGSFDGLFFADLTKVNARLAADCRAQADVRLIPFGEINPLLPNWEAELQRCAETHRMPGIRLHPNYHGYALDHPQLARLLAVTAERQLIVAIAASMEDTRMMHPLLQAPAVNLSPLAPLVERTPGSRLLLLNALQTFRGDPLHRLLNAGEAYVEIAMLEGMGGIEKLLADVPLERVLFGSHAPSFYFESAVLKLQESPLSASQRQAITQENARRLLPSA
jgi:uncharacterized protein